MPLRHLRGPGLYDPFRDLRRFGGLDPAWTGRRPAPASEYPPVNVWTGEHDVIVTIEIPGVDPDALDLAVQQRHLVVKGSKAPPSEARDTAYHRRERTYGAFARTVELPFEVDPAKIQADYQNGILRIYCPRPESEKPRRIKVTRAA